MENLQNQNSQNNLNQLPQQNPKKNIPSWLGFTIIIVVAFLLFGGVFGFQYFVMKSEIPNPKSETNSNIQNSNTQNETAGWKTYKNDEYGFEFKYPSTYKSQEIPIGTPTGLSVSLPRGAVVIHEINNSIINIDLPADCMFDSSALEDKNALSFIDTKLVNGINFYYYINYKTQAKYAGNYCGMSSGCERIDVYRALYKNKCYEIKYGRGNRIYSGPDDYRNATDEEMRVPEIFYEIISTFKFTTPPTSNPQGQDKLWETFYGKYKDNFEKKFGIYSFTIDKNTVLFSPDKKLVSFIVIGYEYSKPYLVEVATGNDIFKNYNIWFDDPKKSLFWFSNENVLVIKNYLNEFSGGGKEAILINGNRNYSLTEIFSLTNEQYLGGSHIENISFSDNKILFSVATRIGISEVKVNYSYDINSKIIKFE